jgi:hypothetical protein
MMSFMGAAAIDSNTAIELQKRISSEPPRRILSTLLYPNFKNSEIHREQRRREYPHLLPLLHHKLCLVASCYEERRTWIREGDHRAVKSTDARPFIST